MAIGPGRIGLSCGLPAHEPGTQNHESVGMLDMDATRSP